MSDDAHNENLPSIERRKLFAHLAKRGERIATVAQAPVQRSVSRPPTAVDDDIFIRLCNQCGECEKACPESIIYMKDGYPSLDIDYSYCTLCEECQKVCPTIALSNERKDIGLRPKVNSNCINLYNYCDSCRDSCGSQAIEWKDNQMPLIDLDKCTGCGRCKSDCFVGAIQLLSV